MARAKKTEEPSILTALKFMTLAQAKDGDAPHKRHCRVINGTISAFDNILAVGQYLPMELPDCCPSTFQFIHALERAKDQSSVVIEQGYITVKTTKFKAIVPTIDGHDMVFINPDPPNWPLNDGFRDAASRAATYTNDSVHGRVVETSVLTLNGGLAGTNGNALVEAYHGTPTPPGLVIPVSFIKALAKIDRRIANFGFTQNDVTNSLTVWFDDSSWIKTQLYAEKWPDIGFIQAMANQATPQDIPKDFWPAVEAVAPFSVTGQVYFRDDQVHSHEHDGQGASHKCKGVPDRHYYALKQLLPLSKVADKVDFVGNQKSAVFLGENCRMIVMKGTH